MDLRARLLSLLPIGPGQELAPGVRLIAASTELGLRLTFDDRGRTVHVEVAPAEAGGKHAARTPRLLLSYRTAAAVAPADGQALCALVARAIAPREDAVLDGAGAEAASARVREVEVTTLLEPGPGFDSLSPYVGCLIGCRFCYAQSRLAGVRRFAGLAPAPWGSWVDARINAPAVLAAELVGRPPRPIKICPVVSDPYHAIERGLALTRGCLATLAAAAAPPPVMILTRSALIERDADLLGTLRAFAGVSLPTADDEVRAHFEPRAASIDERVHALGTLRAAGARTIAVAQPMLPGPVDALADLLAAHVDSVSLDVLHGEEGAAALFDDERFAFARTPAWQAERAAALTAALTARGVAVWTGELPPALTVG